MHPECPRGKIATQSFRNSCNPTGWAVVTDEYQTASSIAANISTQRNVGTIIDRSSWRFHHCLHSVQSETGQFHGTLDALASRWLFPDLYNYLFGFPLPPFVYPSLYIYIYTQGASQVAAQTSPVCSATKAKTKMSLKHGAVNHLLTRYNQKNWNVRETFLS